MTIDDRERREREVAAILDAFNERQARARVATLSIPQAARRLGYSARHTRDLCASFLAGDEMRGIPCVRLRPGAQPRVPVGFVEAYEREVEALAEKAAERARAIVELMARSKRAG